MLVCLQHLTGAGEARIGESEAGAEATDRQRALYSHVVARSPQKYKILRINESSAESEIPNSDMDVGFPGDSRNRRRIER